jgi:hypothetical protein
MLLKSGDLMITGVANMVNHQQQQYLKQQSQRN